MCCVYDVACKKRIQMRACVNCVFAACSVARLYVLRSRITVAVGDQGLGSVTCVSYVWCNPDRIRVDLSIHVVSLCIVLESRYA